MTKEKEIEFSIQEKIILKGIGSPRIEYKSGIDNLDNLITHGTNTHYVNLELLKNGLLLRSTKIRDEQTIFIKKDNIVELFVWVKRYKIIRYLLGKIKYDGTLTIKLADKSYVFYIPQVYFLPFKKFIHKSWLRDKLNYQVDPSPPEIIRIGILMGLFHN